jgi:hypothetical protein
MIYICLKKYASLLSAAFTIFLLFAMTTAFLLYGLRMLSGADTFVVVNTDMDALSFCHFCIAWYIADLFCTYRVIRIYRMYVRVNRRQNL